MKYLALVAALAVASMAAPALAQDEHKDHAAMPAAGGLSVETTPIGDIVKNAAAKAALRTRRSARTSSCPSGGTSTAGSTPRPPGTRS